MYMSNQKLKFIEIWFNKPIKILLDFVFIKYLGSNEIKD